MCNVVIGRIGRQGPKIWDQWGNWSSCSVTCGIGKIARWRHCIGGSCAAGEKKAQLKTCTLAAC
ncbi:properdin-like [Calliopsis andreniformis]|uniref:properdin-like n=1 Tax=Calliopsis andreniformis TaxID=337506 RepID=UPI003FCE843E